MRRYLLVLDMDLLALNEELDLEPINYLVARQEQEQERGEVVVLSLVATPPGEAVPAGACSGRCYRPRPVRPRQSTPPRPSPATMSMLPPSTA